MKIVVACPMLPYPADAGAKIYLLNYLEALSSRHELRIVALTRTPEEKVDGAAFVSKFGQVITVDPPHRKSLLHRLAYRAYYTALASSRSWPMDAFYGCPGNFSKEVTAQAESIGADLVHYDFWFSCLGDLHARPYRRVLLEHDIEYIRRKRQYEFADEKDKAELKKVWLATERAETKALTSLDNILLLTKDDEREAKSVGATNTHVIPSGIDIEKINPPAGEAPPHRLVFVGSFTHHPNLDAMPWFVKEIFPLIRTEVPEVEFSIVGANPTPEILELGNQPGVTVHGSVPEVGPYIESAAIAVIPLRVGSGIKTKVIEAMAYGRPVVTTPVGAEGIQVTEGQDVIVREDAKSFAEAVVSLINDSARARAIGQAGRNLVEKTYSKKAAAERLLEIYEKDIWQPGQG